MAAEWWVVTIPDALGIIVSLIVIYAAIVGLTRIAGLRSFSKMSAPDFAMTVAVGSLFGSSISGPEPTIGVAIVAFASLFAGQWAIAWARTNLGGAGTFVDNSPLLLMNGATVLDQNLKLANVSRSDLRAKLREANVLNYEQVRAVVFETTGDISVLHSDDPQERFDTDLLAEVRGPQGLVE